MVVPQIGASFVLKKLAEEVIAPPSNPGNADQPHVTTELAAPPPIEEDELDGHALTDEEGEEIGTARRLREIAIYVVSDTHGDLASELEECVLDDESRRYFVKDEMGRITGIIYAPHPDRMPHRTEAIRADDI